jgi:2,4-dienoyl-CoA reductase-like NADH-dependent reductase (Old Yellow Enzyme family)
MDLFEPLKLRSVTLRNRIGVAPMCQYSAEEGMATDWHLAHLGARAIGGAGIIIVEATSVLPEGRISPNDLGLWNDAQVEPLARVARFVETQGTVPAIQLGHAGRKASTKRPWDSGSDRPLFEANGGWRSLAPSAIGFDDGYPIPEELDDAGISKVIRAFVAAAKRAIIAGFRAIEIHAAHGYLLHQFLSPLSNGRVDQWGGAFENRIRIVLEVVRAVRKVVADSVPLLVRVSCTDWAEGGWDLVQTIALGKSLATEGVDLIDCSTGGLLPNISIPTGPGFQVPFAQRVREAVQIPTAAVGLITSAPQADQIVRNEMADLVLLGRESLRDPNWPLHAATQLGRDTKWPNQYLRAR